jgi:predicted DNA-binding transcriptional regulator AlpA
MDTIAQKQDGGFVGSALATINADALIDETALAISLNVTKRTVRRMVKRGELPPPIPLAGRSTWLVGHVRSHINQRAKEAAEEAAQAAWRMSRHLPA